MWLVRLRIRKARPWARGRKRFRVGPSSTYAWLMNRSRRSRFLLCSALAMALASTFATGSLADCGAKRRTSSASSASMPRTRSMTRRHFIGVVRTKRACARAAFGGRCRVLFSATTGPPVVLDVTAEGARGRELAELVPDHRLGHEDRDVLAAVVHGDRVPQEVGDDRRTARPRLDDVLGALLVLRVHLLEQVVVDERALLQTARHRGLPLALLVGLAAADDERVARLAATGAALGLAARVDRVATTGGLALTTTVRVVDGVHGDTADGRALALPAHAAGLAPVDVRLLGVADLADGRAAARVDVADLTRGHAQLRHAGVLRNELHARAGRPRDLRATAGPQLDRVHDRADRDVAQRQVVAGLDVGRRAGLDPVALRQPCRSDDVALLAVGVVQQRDARGAVGVVLDVRDLRRHAVLVVATEVDDSVGALVTAALVTDGDPAVNVASALAVQRLDERLLRLGARNLDEVGDARATTTGSRRLVFADTHLDRSSEEVDAVTLGETDYGALGVVAGADTEPRALALALAVGGVDARHLHLEDLLHGDLDLRLVGIGVHQERVLVLVDEPVALLRDDRGEQDVARVGDRCHQLSPPVGSSGVSASSAFSAGASVSLSAAFSNASSALRSWLVCSATSALACSSETPSPAGLVDPASVAGVSLTVVSFGVAGASAPSDVRRPPAGAVSCASVSTASPRRSARFVGDGESSSFGPALSRSRNAASAPSVKMTSSLTSTS